MLIHHKGVYYLFFSTWDKRYNPIWAKTVGSFSGLHGYYSESLHGEYLPVNGNGAILDSGEQLYSVRLIERIGATDRYAALGWLNNDEHGKFDGALSEPFTFTIDGSKVTLSA